MQGHAGHIGNLAGFTHPTQVAILATAGIGFGLFNVFGLIAALSIFFMSCLRIVLDLRKRGITVSEQDRMAVIAEIKNKEYAASSFKAFLPFIVLVVGFILGLPIFLVGLASAIFVMILAHRNMKQSEQNMMEGVGLIATPLVATIGFLFMSTVIKQIGLANTISGFAAPLLSVSPVAVMFLVAFVTGLMTQSYGASAAVVIPFLQVVLGAGADPFAAAFAAASAALSQYFLTGGPVAALSTVIPVVPGSNLKSANHFQRPSILFGCLTAFCISMLLSFF